MWPALKQVWPNPYVRIVVWTLLALLTLAGLYFFLGLTRSIWSSFLIAYLIAYLLHPLLAWVERRGLHRVVGVLAIAVGLILFLALLWLLGIRVAAQLALFVEELPGIIENLREIPFRVAREIDPTFEATFQQVFVNLTQFADGLAERAALIFQGAGIGGRLLRGATAVFGGGAQTVITLILGLYLLYNYPRYSLSFLRVFPHRYRPQVEGIMGDVGYAVGGYIRGQLLIALIVGILTGIGLALLGVPLAAGLGLVTGIANLIPFFGPLLATVPTVFFAFTEGWPTVVGAIAILLAVQQIDANVLTPVVFSQVIDIDPVTTIIAILIGAALFGLVGAIAAVPAAVFLTILYRDYYLDGHWYKQSVAAERNAGE